MVNFLFFFVPASSFFAFMGVYSNKKIGRFIFSLAIVVLTVFMLAQRDVTAPSDYDNYEIMYDMLSTDFMSVFDVYHGNYAFSFAQYIGVLLGLDAEQFYWFLPVLSYLLTAYAFLGIVGNTRYLPITLLFFSFSSTFLLLYLNVIRQGMALTFALLSIPFFLKRQYYKFSLLALLSLLSHSSAVVFFICFALAKFFPFTKKNKRFLFFLVPCAVLVGYVTIIPVANVLGGDFLKVTEYTDFGYQSDVFYIRVFLLCVGLLFFFDRVFKTVDIDSNVSFLFSVYYYLLICAVYTLPVVLVSSRFAYYIGGILPIMIAFSLDGFKKNRSLASVFYFIASLFLGVFVYTYKSTASQLGL